MKRAFTNPYLPILAIPALFLIGLIMLRVSSDVINLAGRVIAFALFAYIGARYVWRAPVLMWKGIFTPEARNVNGWALLIVGSMIQMAYGFLYVIYERPEWLSSQYWAPSFVGLIVVGLGLVASSVPRLPPFGSNPYGLSVLGSLFVGLLSFMFMVAAQHAVEIFTIIKAVFVGSLHAL